MNTTRFKIPATVFLFIVLATTGLFAQTLAGAKSSGHESLLLTAEGKVEISRAGTALWLVARTNLILQTGDRLRTGLRSRAVVRLSNLAVLRVDELTTFVVQPPRTPGKTARIDLESGSTYFFSRERPSDVEFSTPLSSGAIRGTEFNLAVGADGLTVVTLIDGALSISNSLGALDLASGQEARVEPGQPPTKSAVINALNVIQWCLYYPGVLDVSELGLSSDEQQTLADSLGAYRAGDLLGAVADYPAGRLPSSDAEKTYLAALLLAVGQVEQAQAQLGSLSVSPPLADDLREVVAAVKFQTRARATPPTLASDWLAESYYLQSHSKLNEALEAARKSVAQSPNFGFGWERVAELEFSFGRVPAASAALAKAWQLSPHNAEAAALQGFLLAAQNKTSAARVQFDKAIALDGGLGNAWLGRGLVRIHTGDAIGGRNDLQVAVTVEPQRAVLRSYLGKAFSNAGDDRHAEKELKLARKLDPNDPTVWLYSALLDEQENRVNDAVDDLERSQALNDNRSVYRSRLLLDQDEAVRGANLASIYRDDGMTDVSMREASEAVNADYANYSSHLFLANSYYNLLDPSGINLRYETPYVSEYLVANLLAPVGAGTLSQQVSQQEYSKLFEHDGAGASSSTEYTSHGDWYQYGAEYGNFGNTAFAFDQDFSSVNLYRPNSDQQDGLYDFHVKQQLTPKDSAYVEVDLRNTTGGNLAQYYDQAGAAVTPYRFHDEQTPLVIAGLHHEWAPGVDTLFLFSRLNDTYTVGDPDQPSYITTSYGPGGMVQGIIPFPADQNYRSTLNIYSFEAQQIWQTPQWTTIAGARYQTGTFNTVNYEQDFDSGTADLFPPMSAIADQDVQANFGRETLYGYEQWQPVDSLRLIGGVSYDRLEIPEDFRDAPLSADSATSARVLPKAGIIWTPFKNTTLRAGYAQSVSGASIDQSFQLEPAEVAGFTQTFRSLIPESLEGENSGATFTIYGISLEQKLPTRTYLALEGDLLESKVSREDGTFDIDLNNFGPPPSISSLLETLDYGEATLTASAHQLAGRDWTFGAVYAISQANLKDNFPEITPDVASGSGFNSYYDLTGLLQTLNLQSIYQNPCGFFAEGQAVWSHQNNSGYDPGLPGDDFWQFNLQAGWRFFRRHAELSVGILNLTGQDYHLNPLNLYQEAPRDRTFYTEFQFQF